ncbi:hypothetical protein ACFQ1M_07720 [Sungkyunkwania multivorans]|uniref:Uncharacterized protein n=1 Tax=Sungkyunkwania multivorans TaxID=1173618 RepID=A0ABW3CY23_9FLAO
MKKQLIVSLVLFIGFVSITQLQAQVNPSIKKLEQYFNNQQLLITYRQGEVVYGTYYFLEVHYCPNGYYGLYGRSVKETVLGNEQRSNWREYGTWQITSQGGVNGISYKPMNGVPKFVPLYTDRNGGLFISSDISIQKKGRAICR